MIHIALDPMKNKINDHEYNHATFNMNDTYDIVSLPFHKFPKSSVFEMVYVRHPSGRVQERN
jgi:hypothetical protein